MKNLVKLIGIIAFVAVIGFSMIACDNGSGPSRPDPNPNPNPTTGSGRYSGKDVLGNTYSLSVGSSSSRAAKIGDRFSMDVKNRSGTVKWARGTVTGISTDGTLTLRTSTGETFTSNVGGTTLNSVAGDGDEIPQIPLNDGTTLTPRTFDEIYLRATRWVNGTQHGEHWGSGKSVLVRDFPTNVSNLVKNTSSRYSITISGTSNVALNYLQIEVQGLDEDDNWNYLGGFNSGYKTISANVPFSEKVDLNIGNDSFSYNLMDYQEVILQVTNVMNYSNTDHPEWNSNNGTIPEEIPDGQIMATISDFKIVLKDSLKDALAGNLSDFHFGYGEDGMSVDYRQAVWSLSPANVAKAKQPGAKFEFIMLDVPSTLVGIETISPALAFIWQDPVNGLWWQDMSSISGWEGGSYQFNHGTTWQFWTQKMTVDLSEVIQDARFANATELNFIIACWWANGDDTENIDELGIAGANIFVSPPPTEGNMGNYSYGYKADGISTETNQAVWHLDATTLSKAQTAGAKLELVFSEEPDTTSISLALVWADIDSQRWWPNSVEAGPGNANILIVDNNTLKSGVTYDSGAKKLTVNLQTALETYTGFQSATDVNFILACWYGITDSISELGIVSANIVP